MSVTFARQCESAGVRKNGGFVDESVDLVVGGLDLALKQVAALGCLRLIQIKTPDPFSDLCLFT